MLARRFRLSLPGQVRLDVISLLTHILQRDDHFRNTCPCIRITENNKLAKKVSSLLLIEHCCEPC